MGEIELQILQATLDFMNENCVGPQSSSFLYKSLKPRFETITSFSYSYFISLFDNKEMITSQLVQNKIDEFDTSNTTFNNEIVEEPQSEEIQTRKYNRVRPTDNEDDYFYCTKTIRINKYKMLKALYQFFEDSGETRIDVRECYSLLQQAFNLNSVNMAKLKEF